MKVGFGIPKWLIVTALILAAPIVCYSIFFPTFIVSLSHDHGGHGRWRRAFGIERHRDPDDSSNFTLPVCRHVLTKVIGEAVFVDFGQGRNVIALLAAGQNATDVDFPEYVVGKHFQLPEWKTAI